MRTSGGYRSHGYLNTGQDSRNRFIVSARCVHVYEIYEISCTRNVLFLNVFIISMICALRIFLDKRIYLEEPSVSCRATPLWETTNLPATTRNSTWNFRRIHTRLVPHSKRLSSPSITFCGPWVTAFQFSSSIDGDQVIRRNVYCKQEEKNRDFSWSKMYARKKTRVTHVSRDYRGKNLYRKYKSITEKRKKKTRRDTENYRNEYLVCAVVDTFSCLPCLVCIVYWL